MGYQKGKTPTHNLALKEWKWMNEMETNNTTVSWSCNNDETSTNTGVVTSSPITETNDVEIQT